MFYSSLHTMSIAVSAVVKPSKLLSLGVYIVCLTLLCMAAAVGAGRAGNFSTSIRWTLFAILVSSAAIAVSYIFLSRKTFHIDVSGIGQIRLKEDISIDELKRQKEKQRKACSTEVVELMDGSTLWPYMLLLRLRAEDQRIRTLVVLPDCMDSQNFRALSVACRWIAAHNVHNASTTGWGAKK